MSRQDPASLVITPSADVLSAAFDEDENILLEITTGTYFSLEGVGAFLWNAWRQDGSVGRSIDLLVAAYDVDRSVAEADVLALIEDLVGRGLISVGPGERDPAAA